MADMHTPEQIELWALESNMPTAGDLRAPTISQLTRYAALVAQHERERMRDALLAEAGDSIRIAFAVAAIRNSDGG